MVAQALARRRRMPSSPSNRARLTRSAQRPPHRAELVSWESPTSPRATRACGVPAPRLHIAEEIVRNRFTIAGGKAGMKVSWQVTGIRQDAWANAHCIPVKENKPIEECGTYLSPLEHGRPEEMGLRRRQLAILAHAHDR
jgi:hypothetical protein